jgi:hypothetical protein
MGGTGRIAELNKDLKLLTVHIQKLEDTMEKASEFCLNLSMHMSMLSMSGSAASAGLVPMEDFLKFKVGLFGRNSRAGPSRLGMLFSMERTHASASCAST